MWVGVVRLSFKIEWPAWNSKRKRPLKDVRVGHVYINISQGEHCKQSQGHLNVLSVQGTAKPGTYGWTESKERVVDNAESWQRKTSWSAAVDIRKDSAFTPRIGEPWRIFNQGIRKVSFFLACALLFNLAKDIQQASWSFKNT